MTIKEAILNEKELNNITPRILPSVEFRAPVRNYKEFYTKEQIDYLWEHRMIEEYQKCGAALCEKHHWDAENGTITPKQCLDYMGIDWREIRMPQKLRDIYKNDNYYSVITAFYRSWIYEDSLDKWGN